MRYVEPKEFYEDNMFSTESGEADSWRVCWVFEKVLICLGIIAVIESFWWLLPILFFPLSISWLYRATIEGKVGSGYPYPEPGDLIGLIFLAESQGLCASFGF